MSTTSGLQKVWFLRHLDLFATMSDQEVEEIAALLDDRRLPAGVEVLGDGHRDRVYLVKEGAVRISTGEGRRAVTVALLGPGRLFGLSARIGDDDPTISARTVTPTYICVATWGELASALVHHPQIMLQVTRSLAQQVFQIETWRERFGALPPRARLAHLLLDLGDEFGEATDGGRRIPLSLTQADLARMIGASRETTSRLMAEFERSDWVTREKGRLTIVDRAALADLASE